MKRLVPLGALGILGLCLSFIASSPSVAQQANATNGKQVTIDYRTALAGKVDKIEVTVGDTLLVSAQFTGDIGNFEPSAVPAVRNTDKDTGNVFDESGQQVKRLDPKTVQMRAWTAKRVGTAEVVLTNVFNRKQVAVIQVTVKEKVALLPKGAKVIDVSKAGDNLPKEIELKKGETVVFANGFAQVTAKDTDGQGTLMAARPHNTFNQVAAFQATRTGEGEFSVTYGGKGVTPVVTTYKIKITVK